MIGLVVYRGVGRYSVGLWKSIRASHRLHHILFEVENRTRVKLWHDLGWGQFFKEGFLGIIWDR